MKYTGYTKAELIECCQCSEHNYNVMKERFERVSDIANEEANRIINLRTLLKECYKKAHLALQEIQEDCEADEWTIYQYEAVQEFYKLETRINAVLGESELKCLIINTL